MARRAAYGSMRAVSQERSAYGLLALLAVWAVWLADAAAQAPTAAPASEHGSESTPPASGSAARLLAVGPAPVARQGQALPPALASLVERLRVVANAGHAEVAQDAIDRGIDAFQQARSLHHLGQGEAAARAQARLQALVLLAEHQLSRERAQRRQRVAQRAAIEAEAEARAAQRQVEALREELRAAPVPARCVAESERSRPVVDPPTPELGRGAP